MKCTQMKMQTIKLRNLRQQWSKQVIRRSKRTTMRVKTVRIRSSGRKLNLCSKLTMTKSLTWEWSKIVWRRSQCSIMWVIKIWMVWLLISVKAVFLRLQGHTRKITLQRSLRAKWTWKWRKSALWDGVFSLSTRHHNRRTLVISEMRQKIKSFLRCRENLPLA